MQQEKKPPDPTKLEPLNELLSVIRHYRTRRDELPQVTLTMLAFVETNVLFEIKRLEDPSLTSIALRDLDDL